MVLGATLGLVEGGLVVVNDSSLGWMISEKTLQDMSRIKNHGFGLSWGISLRRVAGPLSLA